jgi:diguanylate cyclase (GGDEF)-like protein
LFAQATGVASIITHADGRPITRPSNFCRLCQTLIRNTEKGIKNCYHSDALIGRHHPDGPVIQPCLSGGLWDAGASITVGGKHIANWLIGQVRDQTQDEGRMREYAQEIGVDEPAFIEAFREVPTMPRAQFERVAWALFALAKQLSTLAYQNVQQARFITECQRNEQRIEHLAYYDALTDLPNRTLLAQRAELALALAARRREELAVLFLDLDRFKEINDSLGHTEGDQLLVQVAQRLRESVREVDTVCRLGGDEFVLLLPEAGLEGARKVADKVLALFRQPFIVASHRLHTTLSIGIALYPHDGANFDELLKNADTALYRAKEEGRNTRVFYAREMNMASVARLMLEMELRQAIEDGQLWAYYQPKLRLADGALIGAEALVRWQHPERGLIPPNHFIPVAEASDLIVVLGDWMLAEVCRQLAAWRDAGLPPLSVAVNLAARHFREPGLVGCIVELLAVHELPPQALELELTESTLIETGLPTMDALQALKRLGVGLAIDDFGTGYSSLGYLKRLPITALKIDQSFVRDLVSNPDDRTLARTIVALGHGLGLKVVAEGVETEQQRRILLEQGCDLAQGYLFSRPLPAEDFVAWRTRHYPF